MRIANTVPGSIVDGPGIRFTVFTQGCRHHCPGCHNPQTHDFCGGYEVTVEELAEKLCADPLTEGLTLSGGDPMEQGAECAALAKKAHERGYNVWTYTGYTYEQLRREGNPARLALLNETDVLVDGTFQQTEQSYETRFRGSRNQRLIDLNATRNSGTLTLWQQEDGLSHLTKPES